MVNTNAQQMPVQPLTIDFKKVIRTRTIMFDQEFDRMYCLDVVSALDKLIEYDKVMETPKQLLKVRFNIFSYGGQCDAFIALAHKIEQMQDMGYVVHTHNVSMCASCGFMLSIMGDYKTANEYSRYLNHQISAGVMGTFGEMETTTEEVRRFQETKIGDVTIIDDYAHHPTEIKVTLDAVKQKYPDKKVLLVAHGGVCRIIHNLFCDMENEEFVTYAFPNCGLEKFEF
mgnify:CR=1 FL=1